MTQCLRGQTMGFRIERVLTIFISSTFNSKAIFSLLNACIWMQCNFHLFFLCLLVEQHFTNFFLQCSFFQTDIFIDGIAIVPITLKECTGGCLYKSLTNHKWFTHKNETFKCVSPVYKYKCDSADQTLMSRHRPF